MMNKRECEKAVEEICELCKEKHEVLYGYKGLACAFRAFDNTDCDKVRVFKQLIKEHFELVDLIEKWGLNNLSIEELDEWHDRVIWYVQKCDELNDELTKVNDYYFRVEKAIQTLFGVSADDILEIEKGKDKGL